MKKSSRTFRRILCWLFLISVSWVGIVLLRTSVWEGFEVPSSSMMPTLRVGDIVWVDKTAYGTTWPWQKSQPPPKHMPRRGDVVVFIHPRTKEYYVKRVVAFPGEAVMVLGHRVWVDGELLEHIDPQPDAQEMTLWKSDWDPNAEIRWVAHNDGVRHRVMWSTATPMHAWRLSGYWVVPANALFVLGDWRDESSDSRSWGPLPINDLVGQVRCVVDGGKRTQKVSLSQRTRCSIDDPVR